MPSLVQLKVTLKNVAETMALFDRMEVWRSLDGQGGPFVEVTAASASGARVPDVEASVPVTYSSGPSLPLVGLTLTLRVGEVIFTTTFEGIDSLLLSEAAAQIVSASEQSLRAFVVDNQLILETLSIGTTAVLEVVGGTATTLLRLSTGVAYGKEWRIPLLADQEQYTLLDAASEEGAYYRTRFRNTVTGAVGEFSAPFLAPSTPLVETVVGYVSLVDLSGAALVNRAVLISPKSGVMGGSPSLGIGGPAQRVLTDSTGYAQIRLIRGQSVLVAISGTDIVRDVTAPLDVAIETFNLLDPSYGADDNFTVQRPTLVYANRRSM